MVLSYNSIDLVQKSSSEYIGQTRPCYGTEYEEIQMRSAAYLSGGVLQNCTTKTFVETQNYLRGSLHDQPIEEPIYQATDHICPTEHYGKTDFCNIKSAALQFDPYTRKEFPAYNPSLIQYFPNNVTVGKQVEQLRYQNLEPTCPFRA